MHRKADRFDAEEFIGQSVCGYRLVQFYAEFVLFPARRDLGVGVGIDVRVDPDPDPRDPAWCAGDVAQPTQFRQRLDIDLVNVGSKRRLHLGHRFADPREYNPLRRHAGSERPTQLSLGHHIGAGPETGKVAQDGEVRIRLDRIADKRRLGGKGRGKAPIKGGEAGRGIEIERGPDGRCDPRDRNVFGVQLAAAIGEDVTH